MIRMSQPSLATVGMRSMQWSTEVAQSIDDMTTGWAPRVRCCGTVAFGDFRGVGASHMPAGGDPVH